MVVLCQTCNKSFANKRSLATHKSRFHSKTIKQDGKRQSDAIESETENDGDKAASNLLNDSNNSSSESKENDSGQTSTSNFFLKLMLLR